VSCLSFFFLKSTKALSIFFKQFTACPYMKQTSKMASSGNQVTEAEGHQTPTA